MTYPDPGSPRDVQDALRLSQERLESVLEASAAVATGEQARLVRSELLASLGHEIRTPLNGVVGLVKVLSEADLPPMERKSVDLLRGCANTLLGLVDNMLDISKIEAGQLALEPVSTELPRLLQEIDAATRVRAVDKGLAFDLAPGRDLPDWINADPVRLRQVLLNLLGNAVKFTQRGTVRLRIGVDRKPGQERLLFAITDTGVGIAQAQLARLFTRFGPLDAATTRCFGGGLGLAISQELARLMGGQIGVESREGEGSTFTLDIPLRPATSPLRPRAAGAAGVRPDARILVVEDNEVNQYVLQRMLATLGYQDVTIVADGAQAVRVGRTGAFDLVLMDCQMPVLDGRDATRQLRQAGMRIPIIALTACATDRDRDACLQAGMDDYLTKPIEWPVLGERLQRWLAAAASAQAAPLLAPDRHAAFDSEAIARFFLGDVAFFRQAREVFVRTAPQSLQDLRDALAMGDEEAARRICHRFKGGAGSLGAQRLASLCARYEGGEIPADSVTLWHAEVIGAVDAFVVASERALGRAQA